MSKSIRQIREDLLNTPHDNRAASGPDAMPRNKQPVQRTKALAQNAQRPDKKWKATALAGKQYEPNRTKARHPATPRQRVTGPNETPGVSGGGLGEGYHYDADDAHNTSHYRKWREHVEKHGAHVHVDPEYHDIENATHPKHGHVGDFQFTERGYGRGNGHVSPGKIPNFHGKVVKEQNNEHDDFDPKKTFRQISEMNNGPITQSKRAVKYMFHDGHKDGETRFVGNWRVTHHSSDETPGGWIHKYTAVGPYGHHHTVHVEDSRGHESNGKLTVHHIKESANTSQEGNFDPKESNEEFNERIKDMVYRQATQGANTPIKEAKRYLPTFAQRSPTKQQLKDMSPEERKYHDDANKAYQRASTMKKTFKQIREEQKLPSPTHDVWFSHKRLASGRGITVHAKDDAEAEKLAIAQLKKNEGSNAKHYEVHSVDRIDESATPNFANALVRRQHGYHTKVGVPGEEGFRVYHHSTLIGKGKDAADCTDVMCRHHVMSGHAAGNVSEGRESEYSANRHLSSTSSTSRKPGHYLMRHGTPIHKEPHATSQQALSAYHNLSDKTNVKIQHVKEGYDEGHNFSVGDRVQHVAGGDSSGKSRPGVVKKVEAHLVHVQWPEFKKGDLEVTHRRNLYPHGSPKPVTEGFVVGDKVRVNADEHPRHGHVGQIQHMDAHGGHYIGFSDGHQEPFQQGEIQKIARRNSAIGALTGAGVAESVEHPYATPGGHADHREYGSHGFIHPDRAHHHKLGHYVDYYEKGTGDKKYGMVTHNNGKTIHIKPRSSIPFENRKVGNRQIFKIGHPGTPLKEEGIAMSAGGAGDPGHVQNATDNYASQIDRFGKKRLASMLRRKKPNITGTRAGLKP